VKSERQAEGLAAVVSRACLRNSRIISSLASPLLSYRLVDSKGQLGQGDCTFFLAGVKQLPFDRVLVARGTVLLGSLEVLP